MTGLNYYAARLEGRVSCLLVERYEDGVLKDTDIVSGRMDAVACNTLAEAKNRSLIRKGEHVSCQSNYMTSEAVEINRISAEAKKRWISCHDAEREMRKGRTA